MGDQEKEPAGKPRRESFVSKWKKIVSKDLFSPDFDGYKRLMLKHKEVHEYLQDQVKKGEITEITSNHPDPKLAELGEAFEKMLEHPLCKQFRRNRIHLYVTEPGIISTLTENAAVVGLKSITIAPHLLEIGTQSELKAIIAHELGHLLLLEYTHPRRNLSLWEIINKDHYNHRKEHICDEIALVLSGEPASSLSSFFDKLRKLAMHYQNAAREGLPGVFEEFAPHSEEVEQFLKGYAQAKLGDENTQSETHPSNSKRNIHNEEIYKKLQTPEGRAQVEAELTRKLEAEHRKIFPHHYNRAPHARR